MRKDRTSDCFNKLAEAGAFDYLVSRDVFMFIEDTEQYFNDVTHLIHKGIYQMGWDITNHPRMKNTLKSDETAKENGWQVEIEYLDWYKSGYLIKAIKGFHSLK